MDQHLAGRIYHRQMYIDLIRAFLALYGTRGTLARALGLSGVAVTYWLTPPGPQETKSQPATEAGRRHWSDTISAGPSPADLRGLHLPSPEHAQTLAATLYTDTERRELLLHHLAGAREPLPTHPAADAHPEEIDAALHSIGELHAAALHTDDPRRTKDGYAQVWAAAHNLLPAIDLARLPLQRAQALMFLNDAASVLNRSELALTYAREALLVLSAEPARSDGERHADLRRNALLAEVVTLNNLGLPADALEVADYALILPAGDAEPETWRRSFLEQQVKALGRVQRASVAATEYTAEVATACVAGQPHLTLGIDAYLAAAYLAHGSNRSRRKALRLAERMRTQLPAAAGLVPLRSARCLRVITATYDVVGDVEARDSILQQALAVIRTAGLLHQEAELSRRYGSVPVQ